MVLMLVARVLSVLVGLYYLAWVVPTLLRSFGSKPFGLWTLVFLLPLVGAAISLRRPVIGGVIVALCALYETADLTLLAVGPEPAGYDRNVTIANSIPLVLLPALVAGVLLMLGAWREREARTT